MALYRRPTSWITRANKPSMRTIPLCRPLQFLLLFSCTTLADAVRFSDQTQAQVSTTLAYVEENKQYVLEAHGSGAAFLIQTTMRPDCRNTNGATFSTLKNQPARKRIYEQIETGHFRYKLYQHCSCRLGHGHCHRRRG